MPPLIVIFPPSTWLPEPIPAPFSPPYAYTVPPAIVTSPHFKRSALGKFVVVPYEPIAAPYFPPVALRVPLPLIVSELPDSTYIPHEGVEASPVIMLLPITSIVTTELFLITTALPVPPITALSSFIVVFAPSIIRLSALVTVCLSVELLASTTLANDLG